MATVKQKKVIDKIVGNGGNVTKAMIDVGYSKNTAHTPQKLTESKGFIKESKPIVEQLIKQRQMALDMLKITIDKATYRDLTNGVDVLTKNIQLLSGKPTENIGINTEDKDKINKAIDEVI
jgi:phage terminase small subunit